MAFQTNSSTSGLFTGNIRAQLTPGHQLPRITAEQMMVLEANFKHNRNPNDLEITFIAAEAGMTETDVRVGLCVPIWEHELSRKSFSAEIFSRVRHKLKIWLQRNGMDRLQAF